MTATAVIAGWTQSRYRLFKWRYELVFLKKLGLCLGMAGITGLFAQIRIPLGSTPVPVTGQVFAVLLAGVLLGKHYGALSQYLYVGLGVVGIPWFAQAGSGFPLFTGGYLLGFIPAAALVGWLTDRHIRIRSIWWQAMLLMTAVGIIYLFGAVQYAIVTRNGLALTLAQAVVPFIPFDLLKALAVAGLGSSLLPKSSYNGEVDRAAYPTE